MASVKQQVDHWYTEEKFTTVLDLRAASGLSSLFSIVETLCTYTTLIDDNMNDDFMNVLFKEVLTWRRPVSAAPGFSAGPPSWPSRPQTLFSSPLALCTEPPSSFSFAHGVAPAEDQQHRVLFNPQMLFAITIHLRPFLL